MEKLLLEACLEAMQTGAVVAIRHGRGGLTCSTTEMAPAAAPASKLICKSSAARNGMTPYEIMLSESQGVCCSSPKWARTVLAVQNGA